MKDIDELLPYLKLYFEITHPNLDECYTDGLKCAVANKSIDNNPYAAASKEYEYWLDGWFDGFYGKKPLFELTRLALKAKATNYAANDSSYYPPRQIKNMNFLLKILKITGAIAATAVVGYQVYDLIA